MIKFAINLVYHDSRIARHFISFDCSSGIFNFSALFISRLFTCCFTKSVTLNVRESLHWPCSGCQIGCIFLEFFNWKLSKLTPHTQTDWWHVLCFAECNLLVCKMIATTSFWIIWRLQNIPFRLIFKWWTLQMPEELKRFFWLVLFVTESLSWWYTSDNAI